MEPWEDEAERARWRRVLVPLGASDRQAEVARLVHEGLENKEIAARQSKSVSTVKVDIQVLFAILEVARRKRHLMGQVAWQAVEAACAVRGPAGPRAGVPLPELKLARRSRPASARRSGDRDDSPGRGARP